MILKTFLSLFALIAFSTCQVEQQTYYTGFLKNATTSHTIKILFYKSGIVYPNDTLFLLPGQQLEIGRGFQRGLSDKPGFSSGHFGGPNDSSVVIFDNSYRVAHYSNTPAQLAPKHYINTSLRNIGNPKSYKFETERPSKNSWRKTHHYEFIEEDYLFAK